jgi:putative phage-type endonuclease
MNVGLTPEQRELRRKRIGASEIGAILGLNPYRNALDVWLEKTGQVEPDTTMSAPAEWGLRLEHAIIAKYCDDHGVTEVEYPGTLLHEGGVLCATPDALVTHRNGERVNLQIKTANSFTRQKWGAPGTDAVPDHYWMQVQMEMLHTGLQLSHIAVLFSGVDYAEYVIPRDDEMIAAAISQAHRFWERCVVGGLEPAIDWSGDSVLDSIKARFASHDDEIVPIDDPMLAELVAEYHAAEQAEKAREKTQDALKARILHAIGEHAGIEVGGFRCTWKAVSTKGKTDWEAVARHLGVERLGIEPGALAAIADTYTRPASVSRRFTIKELK